MATFKTRICFLVAWLLFVPLGTGKAAVSLRVNGADANSVTLELEQSCEIEIYSSNATPYTAHIGFQAPDPIGTFTLTAIMPAAGTGAYANPYNQPPYSLAYEVRAMGGPTAGIHFTFQFTAFAPGQVTLELRNVSTGALMDTVVITINQPQGTGACCNPAGYDCQITTYADCHFIWKGVGSDCSACPIAHGACCNRDTGECSITTPIACTHEYLGDGTNCTACAPPQTGSCCNSAISDCFISQQKDCPIPYVWTPGGSCGACGAPPFTVQLQRLEINQAFQKVDGVSDQNFALIETKPFDVNVTLSASEARDVKVELTITNDANIQVGHKGPTVITMAPPALKVCHFLFKDTETKNMTAGDYNFALVVKKTDDTIVNSWKIPYKFKSSKNITLLAVDYDDGVSRILPRWSDDYITFTKQVFPVPWKRSDVNCLEVIHYKTPIMAPRSKFDVILLDAYRALVNYNSSTKGKYADLVCAVIPLDVMNLENSSALGVTYRSKKSVFILPRSNNPEVECTLAHEIGHVYNLGEEYVVSEVPPDIWLLDEYFNFDVYGKPGNPPPLELVAGRFTIAPRRAYGGQSCEFVPDDVTTHPSPSEDHNAQGFPVGWVCDGWYILSGGFNVTYNHEMPPRTLSMMSIGTPITSGYKWISGPEYKWLISALVPPGSGSSPMMASTLASLDFSGQRMLVSGFIDINEHTAQLLPLVPYPNLELTPESEDPNCRFVFKSGADEILGSFNFDIINSDETPYRPKGPFCVVVDLPDNTACIQVTIDGNVAAQSCRTENSPSVTVLSPNGGEQISGDMLITWSASDLDSNNLLYNVEYSYDNGNNWSILTIDTNQTQLTVDSNFLPGGAACLVKVTANDGWNRSEDISDAPFVVPTKPPEVTILEPEDGTVLLNPESVQIRCTAYDPETGDINDFNAIVWSSSIDGLLGVGDLNSFHLSVGQHILTAVATDPEAKIGSASVHVKILALASDFNCDRYVDYLDLAEFAQKWLSACNVPDWCDGTDIDRNGVVDYYDFALFADQWLQVASP